MLCNFGCVFSIAQEDGYLRPDQCLAEIKSNFMGTEYQVNSSYIPSNICSFLVQFLMARPEDLAANLKLEIGAVCYERKAAFNQSPRCMDVVMPGESACYSVDRCPEFSFHGS